MPLLEAVPKESWKIIIKVLVNVLHVSFKVAAHVVRVKENLLKILFDYSEYASQLNVAKSLHYKVGSCMILVPYQNRKFDV